jgi:hypothetical protein
VGKENFLFFSPVSIRCPALTPAFGQFASRPPSHVPHPPFIPNLGSSIALKLGPGRVKERLITTFSEGPWAQATPRPPTRTLLTHPPLPPIFHRPPPAEIRLGTDPNPPASSGFIPLPTTDFPPPGVTGPPPALFLEHGRGTQTRGWVLSPAAGSARGRRAHDRCAFVYPSVPTPLHVLPRERQGVFITLAAGLRGEPRRGAGMRPPRASWSSPRRGAAPKHGGGTTPSDPPAGSSPSGLVCGFSTRATHTPPNHLLQGRGLGRGLLATTLRDFFVADCHPNNQPMGKGRTSNYSINSLFL